LANRFIDEVDEIVNYIHKYPKHFQVKNKNYREAIFKVFLYVMIHEVIEASVIIYALFQTKDDPFKKP